MIACLLNNQSAHLAAFVHDDMACDAHIIHTNRGGAPTYTSAVPVQLR